MTSVKFINLDGDRPWPGVLPPGVNGLPCNLPLQDREHRPGKTGTLKHRWIVQAELEFTSRCARYLQLQMRGVCVCVCAGGGGGGTVSVASVAS